MANTAGSDKNGVTQVGLLTDGRANLTFVGTDEQTRNIFIPGASIGQLVIALIAAGAEFERFQGSEIGDAIPSSHLMGINAAAVASDQSGTDFAISLTTKDELTLRFHFDRNTIQSLATALVATLAKYGTQIVPPHPEVGSRH
jgi:hypothetical protein